jgi:hypothetical protein
MPLMLSVNNRTYNIRTKKSKIKTQNHTFGQVIHKTYIGALICRKKPCCCKRLIEYSSLKTMS